MQGGRFKIVHVVGDIPVSFANTACEPRNFLYFCWYPKNDSSLQRPSKIILGIDPGTVVLGYGLIRVEGQQVSLVEMGVLKLAQYKDDGLDIPEAG